MSAIDFFAAYLSFIFICIGIEIYIFLNNKNAYLKISYDALKNICESYRDGDIRIISKEINRFYEEYVQEDAQTKKFFSNVVVWMDAIIFRVDCGRKSAVILKEYICILKRARDVLEEQNPYNKCEKYQQDILRDIEKLDANEIVVKNILKRTEDEFLRLSTDIRKNERANRISITLGVAGIAVSVIMAFVKI